MLSVVDSCSIIRVQSWDIRGVAPSRAEQALEVSWPKHAGTCAQGRADVVCVGPADWLVITAEPAAPALLQSLDEAFQGSTFRATDVSSALVRFQLKDPSVRLLLAKACSLDVRMQSFAPGKSARTRFAGVPVIVRCIQPSVFECIVSLSFRDYLWSWLNDAAAEFMSH